MLLDSDGNQGDLGVVGGDKGSSVPLFLPCLLTLDDTPTTTGGVLVANTRTRRVPASLEVNKHCSSDKRGTCALKGCVVLLILALAALNRRTEVPKPTNLRPA